VGRRPWLPPGHVDSWASVAARRAMAGAEPTPWLEPIARGASDGRPRISGAEAHARRTITRAESPEETPRESHPDRSKQPGHRDHSRRTDDAGVTRSGAALSCGKNGRRQMPTALQGREAITKRRRPPTLRLGERFDRRPAAGQDGSGAVSTSASRERSAADRRRPSRPAFRAFAMLAIASSRRPSAARAAAKWRRCSGDAARAASPRGESAARASPRASNTKPRASSRSGIGPSSASASSSRASASSAVAGVARPAARRSDRRARSSADQSSPPGHASRSRRYSSSVALRRSSSATTCSRNGRQG